MVGYILFRPVDGDVERVEVRRASRAAVRRELEAAAPPDATILGIVFGPQAQEHLRPVLPVAS